MDEQKAFMVRVSGYSRCFWFDYPQNAEWFMDLCAEEGNTSEAFKRNELGQYELYAYCAMKEED